MSAGATTPSEYSGATSLAEVPDSAGTILVSEYSYSYPYVNFDFGSGNAAYFDLDYVAFKGHLNTSNFLFCDGHVKALKPIATVSSTNMWSCQENDAANTGGGSITDYITHWNILVNKS